MAKVKFNKDYNDLELERRVKANEEVEMTLKRADELVETIQGQKNEFPDYADFDYERLDELKTKDDDKKNDDDKDGKKDTKEGKK